MKEKKRSQERFFFFPGSSSLDDKKPTAQWYETDIGIRNSEAILSVRAPRSCRTHPLAATELAVRRRFECSLELIGDDLPAYAKNQSLNDWLVMLDAIYGGTQNYTKSAFEIHAHLTEVCGVFAKNQFKRRDTQTAATFLPKMFAWSAALVAKVRPRNLDVEDVILRKYPAVCPYCESKPCTCWKGEKPTLDSGRLRKLYYKNAESAGRTLNDFQLMFRQIYRDSWSSESGDPIARIFLRLTEELAEIAEAVRFQHLYPENLDNEIADFFAWWFALVSMMPTQNDEMTLADECLWAAYPGLCLNCQLIPCYCRAGPVRELMSRPIPGQDHRFDELTATNNQGAFREDVHAILKGELRVALPLTCVRIDVDDFKSINTEYGHPAGDAALRHIASAIRSKLRERDRLYRAGGDEFAALFFDFSEDEAAGTMSRVLGALSEKPVRWVSAAGSVTEFPVTLSVGVAECVDPAQIENALEGADKAAYESKARGKATVTRAKDIKPQ